MTRRVMWVCRRAGGVAVLTLGAVAGWLPASAPPATAAVGLNTLAWSTSQSTAGATGATYTYSFNTTGGTTTLNSITMTVPAGTGGSPTVGTVTPPAAAGGSVTLSGTTLTYSFTPSTIKNESVSIQINGLTNTAVAGRYTSTITIYNNGVAVASAGPTSAVTFTSGALVDPTWSASPATAGATGASYTYTFTTATTALLSSVTMTVPPGTAGSPTVGAVTPSAFATGASVALSGTTLTYSFTPATVPAVTAVSIQISGLTNTATTGTYTSALTTQSGAGVVNAGTTPGVSFTGGILALTSPNALTWAATLNGTDQSVVDKVPADQQLTVADTTASGAGWHVTASATTLTNGSHTLADTGTLSLTGSVTLTPGPSGTTAPSAGCAPTTTCTLPTDLTAYPVAITTASTTPTAFTIYDTDRATGLGQIVLGGSAAANPIGWWVKIPANAFAGSYSSTVTLAVVSAP